MKLDLFVDTSRKGISMAVSGEASNGAAPLYAEMVDAAARGETASSILDELLNRVGATLDDVKRVMVTLGPGSFSGLRTGVAFCQGLCFSGKRNLYGVSSLQALECFGTAEGFSADKVAVLIRARNGYWYLRQTVGTKVEERFISTEEVLSKLDANKPAMLVVDAAALADEGIGAFIKQNGIATVDEQGQALSKWAPLFNTVKSSLIQEANYIQPSYFEKLK
ncbi:MAG: tRNA (adenosine(37)-N6)-threonylcarbamoyltransferase complex dimerization subunit type 1 TsaB [Fibrobacter sp.]|nr:tRNA (adenosine(37)-N6)-threonylcarbamoyltransferase complex dimerization subunit type 1 TsaB [Fibrobacter sp.]